MSDEKLLDDGFTGGGEFRPEPVSAGVRFANYLIDIIAFFGLAVVMSLVMGEETGFLMYGVLFLYYTVLEGATGKSLGKMVTGCTVVNEYGDKVDFGAAALRTIIRFVPFEALSIFFGGDGRMWHDRWSKTYVVKANQYS